MPENSLSREERDLLIELRTEMRGIRTDLSNLSNGMTARITAVEQQKLDRTEFNRIQADDLSARNDIEVRMRKVESRIIVYSTVAGCISFVVGVLANVFSGAIHF